jgi:RHS repeat-associated protein
VRVDSSGGGSKQYSSLSDTVNFAFEIGNKSFEMSNHLGNALATLSDMPLGKEVGAVDSIAEYYTAIVNSAQLYYDFGWGMPDRGFEGSLGYAHGFNGKMNDKDWGGQLIQDYGFRLYNPSIGKFLSVDPLAASYPWNSTYAFAENDVIRSIDLEGGERLIRINYYDANGNIGRTRLITITDNQTGNLVNLQTQVNGVPLAGNPDILEINKVDPAIRGAVVPTSVPAFQTFGTSGTGNSPLSGTTPFDNQILARPIGVTSLIDNTQAGDRRPNMEDHIQTIGSTTNRFSFPGSDIPNTNLSTDTYTASLKELPTPIQITFQGSSAQPVSLTAASNAIQPLVAFMNDPINRNSTVQLVGNTGSNSTTDGPYGTGTNVWSRPLPSRNWVDENNTPRTDGTTGQLMNARASFFRNLLIGNGVNSSRITTAPGSHQPTPQNRTVDPIVQP